VLLLFCRVVSVDTLVWLVDCDSLYLLDRKPLVMSAIWGSDPDMPNSIYRVQSSVWRLPKYWPPPPLQPASVSSPRTKSGGYTLAGRGGGGGSIFWKMPDIGLASYSMIPLRIDSNLRAGQDAMSRSILLLVSESLPAIRSISKLKKQILKITVKAPNFRQGFHEKYFLLYNFIRWAPLKKIDQACKIKVFVVSISKFLFWNS
jgi:hypothetical protein